MSSTILIVDDVPAMADQYAYDLRRVGGYEALIARGGAEALETLAREAVDCVILDLEMPGIDGFGVLRAMKERAVDVPVIVYTGTGDFDRCVQAMRLGAFGFIDKAEPMERVVHEIETVLERRRLISEVNAIRRYDGGDSALLGDSPAMRKLKDEIARVAPIPSPVLILGESGSGKEIVAREVHRLSGHAKEPFIAVNSAALPESLVESELFGHERGAFTGAATTRKGAFETAGKGTIFLDEIGELPSQAQAKLLRVIEQREIVRVGSSRTIPVPARVVAATNRNLADEVTHGRFREDLRFRLEVHVLRVPPLRERLSDVPELVEHLLVTTCARFGMRRKRVASDTMSLLMSYEWRRNNVRELRNIVERMIIATDGEEVGVGGVPAEIRSPASPREGAQDGASASGRTFVELKAEAERRIVLLALERNEWHVTQTARELGLADHASLLKVMRRLGIERQENGS